MKIQRVKDGFEFTIHKTDDGRFKVEGIELYYSSTAFQMSLYNKQWVVV